MTSKTYRSRLPYRKPKRYSGADFELPVTGFEGHSTVRAPWRDAQPAARAWSMCVKAPTAAQLELLAPWADFAFQRQASNALEFRALHPAAQECGVPWGDLQRQEERSTASPYISLRADGNAAGLPWGDHAGQHGETTSSRWESGVPAGRSTAARWEQYAAHALTRSALWRRIVERGGYVALPWSPISARSRSTVIVWPPTPPVDDDTILVPDLPVYVMLPTMTAVRLPDRTPIPLLSISLQEELGSFAWTFSAPMARAGLEIINPDDDGAPPQIEVTINGHPWTFIVDGYDDNRRFASNTLTLRGRSLAAGLSAPLAPKRTFTQTADRTAAQLAGDELPTGWTLVWDAVDWLVPGGTFSYQDLAPIEAIAQVASAIGAAVRSHPAQPTLEVVPTYAQSPWEWGDAAPYAILPAGVLGDGSSSWQGGVNPNGVYVYAQHTPSGALVKIAGSDGALQLPMVVDPLLVHADAQRERGRHELASAGRTRLVQRTVPLFASPPPVGMPDLGVVRPGALVEFEDVDGTWRGMVTAVRIDAQRSGRALSVRQHLTIERQYR